MLRKARADTRSLPQIAKEEGLLSAAYLRKANAPFSGAARDRVQRAKASGNFVAGYLREVTNDLQFGLKEAGKIISSGGMSIARDAKNDTVKAAVDTYDTVKSIEKQATTLSKNMSKPVKVSSAVPVRNGKPYRKSAHTRSKPKR